MITALRQAVTSPKAMATEVAAPPLSDEATAVVDQPPAAGVVSAATPRRPLPWLPLVALFLLAIAALLLPRLVSRPREAMPPPPEVEATSSPVEAAALQTESPGAEGVVALEPGWTVFISSDDVRALALQDQYVWTGRSGGLVRWDRVVCFIPATTVTFGKTATTGPLCACHHYAGL